MRHPFTFLTTGLLGLLLLTGCGPSLSPLYRDYEVGPHEGPVEARIEAALTEAGWTLTDASAPNAIATEERKIKEWGLYKVVVSLEVVPVGHEYVRLFFHPYRRYFTGSRSKIPFMNAGLQRSLVNDLNAVFNKHGLQAIGTSRERDEAMTSR